MNGEIALNSNKSGWKLKKGEIVENKLQISEIEFLVQLKKFLSKKTIMKNLYKLCLIKSILNISTKSNHKNENQFDYITYEFAKIYWNYLKEDSINTAIFNGVSYLAEQEILIIKLKSKNNYRKNIVFEELSLQDRQEYLYQTRKIIKRNVIGAVYSDFNKAIYSFDIKNEEIILNESYILYFQKYRLYIDQLLIYRLIEHIKMTEKNNNIFNTYVSKILKLSSNENIKDNYYLVIEDNLKKLIRGVE